MRNLGERSPGRDDNKGKFLEQSELGTEEASLAGVKGVRRK